MSDGIICIGMFSALYVYQSYRFWKLEKIVFTQFAKIWNFQHDVIDTIDTLRKVKELEVEYLTRLSNNENKKNDEGKDNG